MVVGEKEHAVKQTWALHAFCLRLITSPYDTMPRSKNEDRNTTYPVANKNALRSAALEKAGEIRASRREAPRRKCVPQARNKRGANRMTCPVMAAIAASQPNTRTRTTTSSSKPPEPAADPEGVNCTISSYCVSIDYLHMILCMCK